MEEEQREGEQRGQDEIVVVCFNVHSWTDKEGRRNIDRVAHMISAAKADIVGLCEVPFTKKTNYYLSLSQDR